LAKPVLIISRNAADIPIDLSTRRMILYGQSEGDWREDLGIMVSKAIKEILGTYSLNSKEPHLDERVVGPAMPGTIEYAAQSLEAENSSEHTGRVKGVKKSPAYSACKAADH
jgi:hypothetical protein